MAFIGNTPNLGGSRASQIETLDGSTLAFTVSSGYSIGYVEVFLNGIKIVSGTDYTATDGSTVTLTEPAISGDTVEIVTYIPGQMMHPGATGGAGNHVFFESDTNITADYTLTAGKNAMTAGPVTVNSGVTVTVPSGARWVIV